MDADLEQNVDRDGSGRRLQEALRDDAIDAKFGFVRHKGSEEKTGWLLNVHSIEILDEDKRLVSAVDYYFIQDDGSRFKVSLPYRPYFFVVPREGTAPDVLAYLNKRFSGIFAGTEMIQKEDLDLRNHLVGVKQTVIKLSFHTVNDLLKVRRVIQPAVRKNRERAANAAKNVGDCGNFGDFDHVKPIVDQLENMVDMRCIAYHQVKALLRETTIVNIVPLFPKIFSDREYDVPYHIRVSIDNGIFVGKWYTVKVSGGIRPAFQVRDDLIDRPDAIVLAYDIETTKLPLKFPDSNVDQIMMISYMIDGQGFLITNREVIAEDVEDFEFTPKPEFEGLFTVFNEADECSTLKRFFDHIIEIRPHVFVSYNGDNFDWPFVEARAAFHGLDMLKEIGFTKKNDGSYASRPASHMDCLCWVKRDSYLPVGSQGLKAVAKAKLRYDPVEVDPEDMCRMAVEEPQSLANYSVSDAVATYYLYMKYVHPFIFALCTIIPMEPDEVLRKGSGTLCETLLMVKAHEVNVVFPNKQEAVLNKMTEDGHLLDQETYVGGHVEALEAGVFRADIQYRFKTDPTAFEELSEKVERTLEHAIVEEEGVALEDVENLTDVVKEIKEKLQGLHDIPYRVEKPLIYHLDVGAMYPNIILTNRLQPSASVDEEICAACDFNRPDATCQRSMPWMWRGEFMPATRNEYYRIQRQLEGERFPPFEPGGPMRAFHQLSREERAEAEKRRLGDYCRTVYKKTKVTRTELKHTTICQRENSFYIDTVRAFRDRRYEYKGLLKASGPAVAKRQVADAVAKNDAAEIKSAQNREVLYDSLQLAHKCILNSFYGYVMRKGARWYSMEMAGITCYKGASIITRAREIVERIGRPLELDTDGIWCMLPASFPENFVIKTKNPKKPKLTISYPGAMLNILVKEHYTNDQYHDLVDPEEHRYAVRSENSIFFEVDGPYLAMVLPASKEEGKKLKKRYAVFNFDGSLAELKGFEIKRRGELQLIKIFQSSVFESFLKGDCLATCFQAVAKVANYWLDVLYSKAANMTDVELFELISENRSMSRRLEDYGGQKSTSISTARRLAEFLGDQMVKDAGLSCRYVISKRPEGAPVTERAVPTAIFQAEASVQRYYLRKWLKMPGLVDVNVRQMIDWDYYIERLSGTIQKIITIPAALQAVSNPVPRVPHPEWLHKRLSEKDDALKQRRINEMFKPVARPKKPEIGGTDDIEDLGTPKKKSNKENVPIVAKLTESQVKKHRLAPIGYSVSQMGIVTQKDSSNNSIVAAPAEAHWRDVLGAPPKMGKTKADLRAWITFQKKKWALQREQRSRAKLDGRDMDLLRSSVSATTATGAVSGPASRSSLFGVRGGATLLNSPWQIVQVTETPALGVLRAWVLLGAGAELRAVDLLVPRTFYVNHRSTRATEEGNTWKRVMKSLPRSHRVLNLFEYVIPEAAFQEHSSDLVADLSSPEIEGIYETQVPLDFRVLAKLGCVCRVEPGEAQRLRRQYGNSVPQSFHVNQLSFGTCVQYDYLPHGSMKLIFLYHHQVGNKAFFGVFLDAVKKAHVFVLDSVRTNQLPNLATLFANERKKRISDSRYDAAMLPAEGFTFQSEVQTDPAVVFRAIQKLLVAYQGERRGPTLIVLQTKIGQGALLRKIPIIREFPTTRLFIEDATTAFSGLDWQRVGSKLMIKRFIDAPFLLDTFTEQCRYYHLPIGNLSPDIPVLASDVFFARRLLKNNFVLWCSRSDMPDLGGKENDDLRMLMDQEDSSTFEVNNPGCYLTVCVEISIESVPVTALLQAPNLHDMEGGASNIAFDASNQTSVSEMFAKGENAPPPSYDETVACSGALRILRGLVACWLREVSVNRNPYSDNLLLHFYRWMGSSSSLLYDPAIIKILNLLQKKLLKQILADFQRLGAKIVFADANRAIIATNKATLQDADCYVKYVIKTIRSSSIFHSVHMEPVNFWKTLLWMDQANHGGVRMSTIPPPDREPFESDEAQEYLDIDVTWQIMEALPEDGNCRHSFQTFIVMFIDVLHQKMEELSVPISTQAIANSKKTEESVREFLQRFITEEFSQKLFQYTSKARDKLSAWEPSDEQKRASLVMDLAAAKNPVLQFVKSICKVLSLEDSIEEQVRSLRRNLLKLLQIGEYSDESEWENPVPSLPLSKVVCKICSMCSDIDLIRSTHIKLVNGRPHWTCPSCDSPYEKSHIESILINMTRRVFVGATLRDLTCCRCKQVKLANMSGHCECGGNFTDAGMTGGAEELKKTLKLYACVAKHYDLPLLLELVDLN
ncbi:unnamed protein product [Notodromas monacha]|uniref:DNA polymerase epsilon catalytic subunit n=1 Tax=Notodromas monacha TaxID=399045 RepID=A0A7R9BCJ3_9CRUS|nr:unnamed protein product [Notodromas monacha]CAG0912824.1 unnamed protein product [Notodromas monacha]